MPKIGPLCGPGFLIARRVADLIGRTLTEVYWAPNDSSASALEDAVRLARRNVSDDSSKIGVRSAARTKCDWSRVLGQAGIQFRAFHRSDASRVTPLNFVVHFLAAASRFGSVTKSWPRSGCHAVVMRLRFVAVCKISVDNLQLLLFDLSMGWLKRFSTTSCRRKTGIGDIHEPAVRQKLRDLASCSGIAAMRGLFKLDDRSRGVCNSSRWRSFLPLEL
jgi:hypothetical protein